VGRLLLLLLPVGCADFAGNPARFLFERTDREAGGRLTIEEVLPNPLLEAATSFALCDVHEVVQEQFTVAPRFSPNYDRVAESNAPRVSGDDASASSGLSEFAALRQRDSIHDQHSYALTIPNTGEARIGHELRTQWRAMSESEFFLCLRPLISERQKVFECFLVNHVQEDWRAGQERAKRGQGQANEGIFERRRTMLLPLFAGFRQSRGRE